MSGFEDFPGEVATSPAGRPGPESFPNTPEGNRALAQAGVGKGEDDKVRLIQAEFDSETDPEAKAALGRELARAPGEAKAIGAKPGKAGPSGFDAFPGSPKPKDPSPKDDSLLIPFMKGLGKEAGKEAVSVADMVLSLPAMILGSVGQTLGMAAEPFQEHGEGKTHADYSKGREDAYNAVMQKFGNPISKILRLDTDETQVNKGMGFVTKKLREEGDQINTATGGLINADDFMAVTNALMAAGGAKGAKVTGDAVMKKILDKKAEGVKDPVTEAVNDLSFGMDLPKEQRTELHEAAAKVDEKARAFAADNTRAEPVRPGGMPDSVPVTLERAAKISATPEFLRTPEDRIALRGWKEEGGETAGFDRAAEAAAKPPFLRDAVDKAWLQKYGGIAAASVAGLAAWDALDPDQKEHAQTITAMALGLSFGEAGRHERSLAAINELGPATPLGAVLANSTYGMKTLERLPQGSFDFSKAHIEQELKRQDVTEPERAAIKQALEASPGDRVSAKDLVLGVRKATGDFELTAKETPEYADYGLNSIGRAEKNYYANEEKFPEDEHPQRATTTLYRLPPHMEMGDANHFRDKNLFGWTRSFEEGGVRHVVEIQSDLAQHAKGMTPEAKEGLGRELEGAKEAERSARTRLDEAREAVTGSTDQTVRSRYNDAQNVWRSAALTVTELETKLNSAGRADSVAPIVKSWPKRLIREELGRAARETPLPDRIREAETAASNERSYFNKRMKGLFGENWKDNAHARGVAHLHAGRLAEMEKRAADLRALGGKDVVRFATADTVAKVEGWLDHAAHRWDRIGELEREIRNLHEDIAALDKIHEKGTAGTHAYYSALEKSDPEAFKRLQKSAPEKAAALRREVTDKQGVIESIKSEPQTQFSPQHQSIYDRYSRDIEKFLKQQGGTPHTDRHGHTWIDVPVPKKGPVQMYGHADPKLLAIIAGGMVGAYLGYEALDSVSGSLIGAFLGHLGIKAIPGLREALAQTPDARKAMVELRDRLYTLGQANKARGLDMFKLVTKSIPPDWAKYSEEIFNHIDSGKSLSERGEELKKEFIDPIMQANHRAAVQLDLIGYPAAAIFDSLESHRIRKGSRASIFDELEKGAMTGRQTALSPTSPIDKSVNRWTTPSGESAIGVLEKGGKVALYADGKITAKGTVDRKTGELKVGDKTYAKSRATTEDVEKHTQERYHKEPLLAALDNSLRLGSALANAQFLEKLVNMPGFEEFARKAGEPNIPPSWRQPVGVTKLSQYKFEPRMAEVIEDFRGGVPDKEWAKALQRVNRVLVGSMFWNPLPHILNVADHALVEKGLIGNVVGFPQTLKSSFEAYREVNRLGPKYLAYLREGAAFMYPDTILGDFHAKVLKALGTEEKMGPVAKAFGYVNPADMIARLYAGSREALWRWNDIIMMQAYLAKEAKGMTKSEAIREVEKHIPSYRLPERVLGSRALQSALGDPSMTTFGRYDYGRLASYGNMIKDLVGKEKTVKERMHALDQMAMLAVMGTIVYPVVLDTFAQSLTGNKNAEWTRFGASTIPTLLIKMWNGEELPSNAFSRMFHVSPAWELIPEVMANRDLHTGGTFAHTPSEAVSKVGEKIAPINMMAQGEAGKMSKEQMFWSALGIKSPTDEQVAKKHKYIARQEAELAAFKKKAAAKREAK